MKKAKPKKAPPLNVSAVKNALNILKRKEQEEKLKKHGFFNILNKIF